MNFKKCNKEFEPIKVFKDEKYESKIKYFPHELKVLFKNDLKNIFDYVKNKYGNDFISLYQNAAVV